MLTLLLGSWYFVQSIREAIGEPKFKRALYLVLILLAAGTTFYHQIEGWGWLDSLYFCVITLATVGYGDFTPATRLGKLFTMLYILIGIGTLLSLIDAVADRSLAREARRGGQQRPHLLGKRRRSAAVDGTDDSEPVEATRSE